MRLHVIIFLAYCQAYESGNLCTKMMVSLFIYIYVYICIILFNALGKKPADEPQFQRLLVNGREIGFVQRWKRESIKMFWSNVSESF